MNNLSFVTNPFTFPLLLALLGIYQGLVFLHVPYALGFAIIAFTLIIRLILSPITAAQLDISKKMQKIAPHISKLKEKHKDDQKMLQQETMKLYKEHGLNPAAGCIPALIQLPIIWGLYNTLTHVASVDPGKVMPVINAHLPHALSFLKLAHPWDTNFFGIPIGQPISHLVSHLGPVVFLIPVLTAVLQLIQSKMIAPLPQPKTDKKTQDDFATTFQAQSTYLFPIMIGFFSYSLPFGLSLYWNTFTLFGILQQYFIVGLGGLTPWTDKLKGKK